MCFFAKICNFVWYSFLKKSYIFCIPISKYVSNYILNSNQYNTCILYICINPETTYNIKYVYTIWVSDLGSEVYMCGSNLINLLSINRLIFLLNDLFLWKFSRKINIYKCWRPAKIIPLIILKFHFTVSLKINLYIFDF